MFNNQIIAGAAGQGGSFYPYSIDQSLRFNDNDSAYLSRTPASAGNRKTWTWSGWVKLGNLSTRRFLFSGGTGTGDTTNASIEIYSDNTLRYSTGSTLYRSTSQVFRDPSAFYHILVSFDSTNATADDRCRIYINGDRVTSFASTATISQNTDYGINRAEEHQLGSTVYNGSSGLYLDGYLAEVNFIDGTALDPTSFGETINGVWVPKRYSGSYGTNGFYLPFDDSSAIGDDESGNTNDFTANNLAASDVVLDSPTNNWATNNGAMRANITQSEGNLKMVGVGGNFDNMASTFTFDVEDADGWYWEYRSIGNDNSTTVGISTPQNSQFNQSDPTSAFSNTTACVGYQGSGVKQIAGSNSSYGDSWTAGDIISVAVKAGAVYFYKNGTIQNSGTAAATGLTGDYVAAFAINGTQSGTANYGQDSTFAGLETAGGNSDANGYGDFAYSVPSGYKALCSANLPEATISPNAEAQADDYFNTVLYTGNGSTQSITGVGHQPDFVWIKDRTTTGLGNVLFDSVRGAGKYLFSSATDAEGSGSGILDSFDADGFTLGSNGHVNASSDAYVAWNWKAGGTAVSNTDGSITSQVSANQDSGFSIVSYTGNLTSGATVGHGLSEKPEIIFVKNRDSAQNWNVWNKDLTSETVLYLNLTAGQNNSPASFGTHTNQVFGVDNGVESNGNGNAMIAYCFHSVEGFSKVGKYVGNGSTDGTFVYTGFRPAWVMIKSSNLTYGWVIVDTVRNTYNVVNSNLFPHASSAEDSSTGYFNIDAVSNGFKVRTSNAVSNQSGGSYIYLCFAEQPLKFANAR